VSHVPSAAGRIVCSTVPSVILVRHGQASFGAASYDVLSEVGYRQAELTALELRRRGARVECVVAGTLARQRDTAANGFSILTGYGLPYLVDADAIQSAIACRLVAQLAHADPRG